uniref:Rhodopsin domain-containing protein n=1 Tax=Talaromyces marneffei PM1 TaxID=1077442 RepID=A0A093VNU2_TALMA
MSVNLNDNDQARILGSTIAVSVLADIAIILRFVSRKIKGSYAIDDLLAVIGLQVNFFKALMAYEIIYFVSLAATKMSILLFYTRLFPTREFKLAAKVIACIVTAWLIATILVSVFSCSPVRAFWTHEAGSKCINSEQFYIANAVPNIITDAFILTLPLRMVWGLHTSKWERVALTFIFMLGSFVVVASIIRLSQLHEVSNPDFTWGFNNTVIWSSVEPSVAVISACLPTMRPVVEFILPRSWRTRSFKSSSHAHSFSQDTSKYMGKPSKVPDTDHHTIDSEDQRLNGYWAGSYGQEVPLNPIAKSSRQPFNEYSKDASSRSREIHVETNINVSASSIV